MGKKDPEKEIFTAAFGSIFADASNGMIQKCWMRFKALPPEARQELLAGLFAAAKAKLGL